jgi:hypothetical protein
MLALVANAPTRAIVMRHDRDEPLFLELATKFPATVTVRRADGRNGLGDQGTLIAPQWVLTAAHVAAELGAGDFAEVGGTTYRIDSAIRHPEWRSNADIKVDIALLKLTEDVAGVAPAALYTATDELGMVLTFVGRGGNATGLTGPVAEHRHLRAATNRVETVEASLLRFRFDAPGEPGITELEGVSGPGDSGGPAFLERDGHFYCVGVISAQDSRPADRQQGRYKVLEYYPRVSHFAAWLRQTMADRSPAEPQGVAAARTEQLQLPSPAGRLGGTLTMPRSARQPVGR